MVRCLLAFVLLLLILFTSILKHVTSLAVLADGRLASGSRDWTIRIWNLGSLLSGACDRVLEGHKGVRERGGRVVTVFIIQ